MKILKLIGCCAVMLMMLAGSANAMQLEIVIVRSTDNPDNIIVYPPCGPSGSRGAFEAGSPEFREALAYALADAQCLSTHTNNNYHVQINPVQDIKK